MRRLFACLLIFSSLSVAAPSTDAAGDTSEIIEIDEVSPVPAPSVAPPVQQTQEPGDTIEGNRRLEQKSADQDLLTVDDEYQPRDIPPAPTRPIGKTAVGIGLSCAGGVVLVCDLVLLSLFASTGIIEYGGPMLLVYTGLGCGLFIPGMALVASAKGDWNRYNDWERKYPRRSGGPALGVECSFEF